MDDDGRPQFLGGREHGLHGELVEYVDRGHAIPLGEGAVEDFTSRHNRHGFASLDWGSHDDWARCRALPGIILCCSTPPTGRPVVEWDGRLTVALVGVVQDGLG